MYAPIVNICLRLSRYLLSDFSFEIDNIANVKKNWKINLIKRVLVKPSVNSAPIALENRKQESK